MAQSERNQSMGEGDRESARRYNEDTRDYVESEDVEQAARDAEPQNAREGEALEEAEKDGKSHAKERDPNIPRDYSQSD